MNTNTLIVGLVVLVALGGAAYLVSQSMKATSDANARALEAERRVTDAGRRTRGEQLGGAVETTVNFLDSINPFG